MEKRDKVDLSNVRFASVKLVNGGLKGCKCEYEKVEKVGEREFRNVYKPEAKYPIHREMEECFEWLREHLLLICGYNTKKDVTLVDRVEVTGVTAGENSFVISGKLEVYDNGKVVSLVTPYTTSEEEYEGYDAVMKIIVGIYEETKVYLSRTVVMDDVQLVMKFHKHDKEFDEDSFKLLPAMEQKRIATKILEKQKCIVLEEGDLNPDGVNDLIDTGLGIKDKTMVPAIVNESTNDEKEFSFSQEIDNSEIVEEGDDFDLGITVVKELVITLTPNNFVIEQTETGTVLSIASNNDDEIDLSEIVKKQEAAKVSTAQKIKPVATSVGIDTPFEDLE